jgi:hypothetical protein
MKISIDTSDWAGYVEAMQKMPDDMLKNGLRPALRKAAQVVKREQISLLKDIIARDHTGLSKGLLQKSLSYVTTRFKQGDKTATVLIGIVKKAGPLLAPDVTHKKPKGWYWIYLEKGFTAGTLRKAARHTQHAHLAMLIKSHFIPGRPFVGPSVPNKKAEIASAMQAKISDYMSGDNPVNSRKNKVKK